MVDVIICDRCGSHIPKGKRMVVEIDGKYVDTCRKCNAGLVRVMNKYIGNSK